MSIPFWRYVTYTDDGCSVYECLDCYRSWEARTDPKYSEWKFCPYCGCEWEGQKEWNSNVKWDRQKGRNPDPGSRLCLPLFVVQKRSVPLEEESFDEWKSVHNGSLSIQDALWTIRNESALELDHEFFWCYEEYRIVFDPYKSRYSFKSEAEKTLRWVDPKINESILDFWRQYKINIQNIQDKKIEYFKKKGA